MRSGLRSLDTLCRLAYTYDLWTSVGFETKLSDGAEHWSDLPGSHLVT